MERIKVIGAADLGHGWVKLQVNGKTWRQPSVVGEARQLFEDSIQSDDVQYKGTRDGEPVDYFVGDLALRHSKIKYAATADEKAKNWTSKILLEAGLGITAPNNNICLVTGLPVDAYFTQKQQMEDLLSSLNSAEPYEVSQGKRRTVARPWVFANKIVPQPFGSAMNYLLDDKGQIAKADDAKKKLLVIDIGYYTLDLLTLDAMQIGKDSSSPLGLGADTAYKLIQDYLKEKLGKAPGRYDLDRYVRAGVYDGIDIRQLTAKAFEALASQIDLEVRQLNTAFHKYIVTGGWAAEVVKNLTLPKDRTVVMDQLGNVTGYGKIGRRTWREAM
jgi:plasmid segregation protein ParM